MSPEDVTAIGKWVLEHGGEWKGENWFMRILHSVVRRVIYLSTPFRSASSNRLPDGEQFSRAIRYYLAEEYPTKIRLAVGALSDEMIWRRPNDESTALHLLLHRAATSVSGLQAELAGSRRTHRADEFAARTGPGTTELLAGLESTVREADRVPRTLRESDLNRAITIQGRGTTVFGAVYTCRTRLDATGQILMLAKIYAPGSVKFYEDAASSRAVVGR